MMRHNTISLLVGDSLCLSILHDLSDGVKGIGILAYTHKDVAIHDILYCNCNRGGFLLKPFHTNIRHISTQ